MPRIPESAVTVGIPAVSDQPIRSAIQIGRAISDTLGATAQLTSKLAEAERAEELTRKSAALEGSLGDLEFQIESDPDLGTVEAAGAAYAEESQKIFEELGESTSPTVSLALEKQFLQSSGRGAISVRAKAFGRTKDAAIANLDTAEETYERRYAVAPDDDEREKYRALMARGTMLSEFISEEEKGKRIRAWDNRTQTQRVRSLIDAGDFDGAQALLDSGDLFGIDPTETLELERTLASGERAVRREHSALAREIRIAKRQAETDRKSALKEYRSQEHHSLLERMALPTEAAPYPTLPEVFAANLSTSATTSLVKEIEAHAKGEDLTTSNTFIDIATYERVHDENNPRYITDADQLLPLLGKGGLTADRIAFYRKEIENRDKPERKIEQTAFKVLTDFGKRTILGNALVSQADPEGAELYKSFWVIAKARFDQGLKDGKDPYDMITSGHKDYIADFINQPPFPRTQSDVTRSKQKARKDALERERAAKAAQTTTPTPTSTPTPTPTAVAPGPNEPLEIQRLENESTLDYLNRVKAASP